MSTLNASSACISKAGYGFVEGFEMSVYLLAKNKGRATVGILLSHVASHGSNKARPCFQRFSYFGRNYACLGLTQRLSYTRNKKQQQRRRQCD
jgi:hypothetical protein